MPRLCLVVQRYGKEIVGGSEQLARCYARLLKSDYEVHVASSCAADYITWKNEFPEGTSDDDGVQVHRFASDMERTEFWHQLHSLLLLRHVIGAASNSSVQQSERVEQWPKFWAEPEAKERVKRAVKRLPLAVQEEFIRRQGPYSRALFQFLAQPGQFDQFLFFTYLYPTTYFGCTCVSRQQRLLIPTLHDEPAAYLPAFHGMMRLFDRYVFLSQGEREVAQTVCGIQREGPVVGIPIEPVGADGPRRVAPFPLPALLRPHRSGERKPHVV